MKKGLLLALIAVALMVSPVFASVPGAVIGGGVNTAQYHSYDGLICTDCHTLHNSDGGVRLVGNKTQSGTEDWTPGPYRELLKKGDWTDMCLSCHREGNNMSSTADLVGVTDGGWTAPIVMTLTGTAPAGLSMPAGDFYYSNLFPTKGHNPAYTKGAVGGAATSKMMAADPTLGSTPPGGSITDGEWSCHSCHGMHARFSGSYSAWRQLKRKVNGICIDKDPADTAVDSIVGDCGTGVNQNAAYEPIKSNSRGNLINSGLDYVNVRGDLQPLDAADLGATEGDTNKNVYRGGFSSFCSTCHGNFHGGNGETRTTDNGVTRVSGAWVKHPTNVAMNEAGSKYGISTYTKVMTNKQATSPNPVGYDWKYPLVVPDTNPNNVLSSVSSKDTATTLTGPERIMCLTCHKAHASQFENMTRWNTEDHAFIANTVVDAWGEASNGDNPAYGCGKCHQKGGTAAFVKQF